MPYQRTYSAKPTDIVREWHLVDVSDQILGRIASRIASLLKGKHKPIYTPSMDTGDHVVVINAEQVRVTGEKDDKKVYYRYGKTGFPGSLKEESYKFLQGRHPEDIIIRAVQRMLPRNALGRQMMTKLRVYKGSEHPHVAQKPVLKQLVSAKAKE